MDVREAGGSRNGDGQEKKDLTCKGQKWMGRRHIIKPGFISVFVFILIFYHGTKANEPNEAVIEGISEKVTKYTIIERKEMYIMTGTARKDEEKEEEADEDTISLIAYIRGDGDFRVERSEPNGLFIKRDSQTRQLKAKKNKAVLIPDERKDFPICLVKGEGLTEELSELVISKEAAFMQKHYQRRWEKTTGECVYNIYLAVVDGAVIEFTCEKGSREPVQIRITQRYDKITTYIYESIEEGIEADDELFEIPESFKLVEPKAKIERAASEQEPVSGKKAWALGFSSPLSEMNHDRYDILPVDEITPWNIQHTKNKLTSGWGIENRKDLLETISDLKAGGHRKSFKETADMLSTLNEEEFQKILEEKPYDSEKMFEIAVVREYAEEVGERSLLAWDYVRMIHLSRRGYLVGYITEEEAWEIIIPLAEELQQNYKSWKELGSHYFIGRLFWSPYQMREDEDIYTEAMMRLTEMPTSPWNMYPWDMEFEEEEEEGKETF